MRRRRRNERRSRPAEILTRKKRERQRDLALNARERPLDRIDDG
jgi:hypothetical protein